MKTSEIVLFGNPVLREKAAPVTVFHDKLRKKIDLISHTLKEHGGGAALAAPQIALSQQITVINYLGEYLELVNPVIIERSGEVEDYEGCLSLPGFIGKVRRAESVTVSFRDRQGKEHQITRSGEMAKCLQHEIDHLEGVLYIDRVVEDHLYSTVDDSILPVEELLARAPREND